MDYRFYGWETADVTPTDEQYGLVRDPRVMYDILTAVWSRETCAPRYRPDWSEENRTLGQCSITSFLVQDIFGGRVFGVPLEDGSFHCYNAVDDCVFDLTSEQFGGAKLAYTLENEQFRDIQLADPEKRGRYKLLKKGFLRALTVRAYGEKAVALKHNGHNCCQAVLAAFAEETEVSPELMRSFGASFGGGMGCMESTCGALCGAQMILGLAKRQGLGARKMPRELLTAFQNRCGATICKDLKGAATGTVLCSCDDCVRNAAEIAAELFT